MLLTPLQGMGALWWVGSSYAWEFDNPDPTAEFREKTEQLLNSWLKVPFKIISHLSGVRPATLERRPFVGFHPQHPAIGILNGMGTKGNLTVCFTHGKSNRGFKPLTRGVDQADQCDWGLADAGGEGGQAIKFRFLGCIKNVIRQECLESCCFIVGIRGFLHRPPIVMTDE